MTDGVVRSGDYPDALARLWSALECHRTGDVLVSAEPGYEFVDWGGHAHVGGGSHGSLHRCDSLGVLLTCGIEHARARAVVDRGRDAAGPRPPRRGGVSAQRVHTARPREGVRRRHNWVQLVKFCAVGGSGYVVNLAVFTLAVEVARRFTIWWRPRWRSWWP